MNCDAPKRDHASGSVQTLPCIVRPLSPRSKSALLPVGCHPVFVELIYIAEKVSLCFHAVCFRWPNVTSPASERFQAANRAPSEVKLAYFFRESREFECRWRTCFSDKLSFEHLFDMLIQCLHILTALSFPPLPTLSPSGLQSTAKTSSWCPGRSSFSFPVVTSQTLSVVSLLPLTNNLLSAEKHDMYTGPT